MTTKKIVYSILITLLLFSCRTFNAEKTAKETAIIMADASDALETIIGAFKEGDIVFYCDAFHSLQNDAIFLNSNLQRLYDAGVRYILAEGGIDDGPIYSDEWLLKKAVLLYYPWEPVGLRYGVNSLRYEIFLLNQGKKEEDKIKYIGLESGRSNFVPGTKEEVDINNYRDSYMAETAFKFIDNALPNEKFLVCMGAAHAPTEIVPNAFASTKPYKPLGAYLKEKYGDKVVSLSYLTLDGFIRTDPYHQPMLNTQEWKDISNVPKYVTSSKVERLRDLFPIGEHQKGLDGSIVEKNAIKGIMYSYALFDPEILSAIIEQTRQYEDDITKLANENRLDYDNPDIHYDITRFLANIYYLKLYYGDNFPYEFWNPKMSLKDALARLETAVFVAGTSPQDKMAFPLPSMDSLREYHYYIEQFSSLEPNNLINSIRNNNKEQIKVFGPYIQRAKEIFPYEMWSDYWFAVMYSRANDHKKAYEYLYKIINNPLANSLYFLPEIIDLLIQSTEAIRKYEEASSYKSFKASLLNEFSIDVSHFYYDLVQ